MIIKEQLEEFAARCREARERGDDLPTWEGGNLWRSDLQDANLQGANLQDADLEGAKLQHADLRFAKLQHADLRFANLQDADLRFANLQDANLEDANLEGANLRDANLRDANLEDANLEGANLEGANLRDANLRDANLRDANLHGTRMPDGRVFQDYIRDPLAGICDDPEARKRAIAAWGNHSWDDCPMHEAHGWSEFDDVPNGKRIAVSTFIALFDGKLLQKPEVR